MGRWATEPREPGKPTAWQAASTLRLCARALRLVWAQVPACVSINHLPLGNSSLPKCVCVLPGEGKQGTSV